MYSGRRHRFSNVQRSVGTQMVSHIKMAGWALARRGGRRAGRQAAPAPPEAPVRGGPLRRRGAARGGGPAQPCCRPAPPRCALQFGAARLHGPCAPHRQRAGDTLRALPRAAARAALPPPRVPAQAPAPTAVRAPCHSDPIPPGEKLVAANNSPSKCTTRRDD